MGLPIWKPRRRSIDEIQEDVHKQQIQMARSLLRQRVNTEGMPVITRHSYESALHTPSHVRRHRISRRQNLLTSSFGDRRPNSNSSVEQSELDRRIDQCISEKEDLLEQLQVTVSLLDQFLSARTRLGQEAVNIPEFITQGMYLPDILESATSLAAMSPSELVFSSPTINTSSNVQSVVEALLQIPPYSTRVQDVEANILSAHRRIRQQLNSLASLRRIRSPSPSSRSPPRSSPFSRSSSSSSTPRVRSRRPRVIFIDTDASP
ncbi:hypothetical protein RMATCC62417_04355 [Rhizopus microsporus]|nr:hypothetical protein RMATCC62417_04355 [Rhizopus microsporus]